MPDDTTPLSSEELIAAARRDLESTPTPVVPEPDPAEVDPSEWATPASEPVPIATESPLPPVFPGETLPGDPFPVAPDYPGRPVDAARMPPPPPVEKKKSFDPRMLLRIGGAAVFGVIIISRIFFSATDVDSLSISDCFNEPSAEEFAEVDTVGCDDAHDYEFMGDVELSFAANAAYPGDDEAFFDAVEQCIGIFDSYVGLPFSESQWYVTAFYPTAASFRDGERTAKCAIYLPTPDGNAIARGTTRAVNSGT